MGREHREGYRISSNGVDMNDIGHDDEEFRKAHDPIHKVGVTSTQFIRDLPAATDCFIVTSALNATPVDDCWWAILRNIAQHMGAELMVIPIRYKNPTSQWGGSQRGEEYWVKEVRPYLCNQRVRLNSNLTILGDLKIQPTASSPLTGADALSLSSSGIIGHTKLQMKTVATPSNRMAKILTTTGACTVANYTDSRAGVIGDFHHSLSAILVEIRGSKFYMRQLHFDRTSGTCTDLNTRYGPDSIESAPRPLALVMGDTHVRFMDPKVDDATWGIDGLVPILNPEHVIWHDTLDSYSCSPHHEGNPFIAEAKQMSGADNVESEVNEAIDYIRKRSRENPEVTHVFVPSNHDDMLSRWVRRADWKTSASREFYLESALAVVRGTRMGLGGAEYPDVFSYWVRQHLAASNVMVLNRDESFVLGNVELGMHGDIGPNGARGSRMNLRRIGIRSVIGHSHQPGIEEGCYQTGTSTRLRLEYNHGASGWLNAHVLVNADGKRQIIIIVDGKWRA
jgi:hypothetical protein